MPVCAILGILMRGNRYVLNVTTSVNLARILKLALVVPTQVSEYFRMTPVFVLLVFMIMAPSNAKPVMQLAKLVK